MGIIGGMSVIAVITFGIPRLQNQRHVHQRLVNPPTGTRSESLVPAKHNRLTVNFVTSLYFFQSSHMIGIPIYPAL